MITLGGVHLLSTMYIGMPTRGAALNRSTAPGPADAARLACVLCLVVFMAALGVNPHFWFARVTAVGYLVTMSCTRTVTGPVAIHYVDTTRLSLATMRLTSASHGATGSSHSTTLVSVAHRHLSARVSCGGNVTRTRTRHDSTLQRFCGYNVIPISAVWKLHDTVRAPPHVLILITPVCARTQATTMVRQYCSAWLCRPGFVVPSFCERTINARRRLPRYHQTLATTTRRRGRDDATCK